MPATRSTSNPVNGRSGRFCRLLPGATTVGRVTGRAAAAECDELPLPGSGALAARAADPFDPLAADCTAPDAACETPAPAGACRTPDGAGRPLLLAGAARLGAAA